MKTKAVAYMINGDDIKNKLSFLIIISVAGVCIYVYRKWNYWYLLTKLGNDNEKEIYLCLFIINI